ncbi:YeeE/YedE family protein [Rhodobacter sp. KR11]|uniref:YeeE/YedE family protein n=1 Tax=Rhodobacter sp. KR11 TaxID=2974588 RepID=UPI0022235A4A|nr:YeeE/YedE family protein [Rhodobacter sp. KR11]MCW1919334.1 YeeE/YedE family protein [Rhodobacter sp. KR11]
MPTDWIWGLVGGLMIGTAGAAFLLLNGRIMGVTGVLGGLVDGTERRGALPFLAGLILAPALAAALWGGQSHLTGNLSLVALAGVLVGFGTRLANGCTSGHGVCGMSRLAPRGILASLTYILAGALVMAVLRQGLGVL